MPALGSRAAVMCSAVSSVVAERKCWLLQAWAGVGAFRRHSRRVFGTASETALRNSPIVHLASGFLKSSSHTKVLSPASCADSIMRGRSDREAIRNTMRGYCAYTIHDMTLLTIPACCSPDW